MKEMRGNINGIAKEYVEEMFKNKNGIMSPAELHFATLSNSVNRYRISFLSSVYTTGKWNLMAENPTEETAEFCQLDKSAGKEECTDMIECLMHEIISNDSSTDNIFVQAVIRPLSVVAQKTWTVQDVAAMLEEENIEPTDDNIQKIIDTGILDRLSYCDDSEWDIIREAVKQLRWTTVCLQYNGIPKNIYLVPSGQLYFVQGLLKLSHDDDTFEELLDSHNISYYKYNVYGVSDNKNSHGHFVCHADAFIL